MDQHNADHPKIATRIPSPMGAPFNLLLDSEGNLHVDPVPGVEWEDAQAFIAWLCEQAGRPDPIGDLGADLVEDCRRRSETPTCSRLLSGVECGCAGAQRALEAALRQFHAVSVFS